MRRTGYFAAIAALTRLPVVTAAIVYGAQAEGCSSDPSVGVRRAFVQHAEPEATRRSEREGDGISVLPSPHAVDSACVTTANSPTVHLAFMTACLLSKNLQEAHNNASITAMALRALH